MMCAFSTFETPLAAMTRRDALRVVAGSLVCSLAYAAPVLRLATFRADATPPLGEPDIWNVPLAKVEEPLLAKGLVLEDANTRYVLCAIDWCKLSNGSELTFRRKIAAAADTDPLRVAVRTLHQHAAPGADSDTNKLLDEAPNPPLHLSDKFLEDVTDRLAAAVKQAVTDLQPFDRIGTGEAKVDRVASTRRIHGPEGKIIVRFSGGGSNPKLAAAPEGFIDPMLKTITLASGRKPLVRLHYYATHPQTWSSRAGLASSDIVGIARETLERDEKVFQIYFTGCAGNVTVGKYNDGTPAAREGLMQRLRAGMEAAIASTRFAPARRLRWRTVPLTLPLRTYPGHTPADFRRRLEDPEGKVESRVGNARALAFAERIQRPLALSSLEMGKVHILHLPGEPFLEFQMYAQQLKPRDFVVVAGYGDCGTGYICTDQAFVEGGYEPTGANVGPGSEALLKKAIRQLLGE